MWATEGEMPELGPPIGEIDTGMGGNLSIRGVVRDSSGAVVPYINVSGSVYKEGGGGEFGHLWNGELLTDETGAFAFNNLLRAKGGWYEVWFNNPQGDERTYEESGYYFEEREIIGDTHLLNVTVYPVTGSAFYGTIQYEDADGVTKNYLSSPPGPDRFIDINRGTGDNQVYIVGEPISDDGNAIYFSNLAGGTYYLLIRLITSDGVLVFCHSPSFEIPPGETKQFDYTIPLSSCWDA